MDLTQCFTKGFKLLFQHWIKIYLSDQGAWFVWWSDILKLKVKDAIEIEIFDAY